jgi:hypothetical protein
MEETKVKPNPPATTAAPKKPAPKKKAPARKPAVEKTPDTQAAAVVKADVDPTERTRQLLNSEKKVTVVINSTAEDKDDVFVAINGYSMTIMRDKEVQIPFSIYQALMDSKTTVYRQVKREDGEGMQMVETEIQRFSMSARF